MESVTPNSHSAPRRVAIVLLVLAFSPCLLVMTVATVAVIAALLLLYAGVRIAIWGLLLFGRWVRSVWTRIRTIPDFRAGFRNGIAATLIATAIIVLSLGGVGSGYKIVNGLYEWFVATFTTSSLAGAAEDGDVFNGCNEACQAKIKARRASVVGIESTELKYVKEQLHREYAPSTLWNTTRVKTCLANWGMYEKAQEYTMYPAELLAGKAYVEGIGCTFAHSGDGGYGPMQITTPEPWHEKAVGAMLHEKPSWVKDAWHGRLEDKSWNYWTNVLMGAVMLSGYEEQFNSRGVGIFAYNSGAGATKKYMRIAGIKPGAYERHTISDFRGAIPVGFNDGSRPQRYLDRILAGAVMVDRAHRGLPVTDGAWIDELTLADIPGADPSRDSIR